MPKVKAPGGYRKGGPGGPGIPPSGVPATMMNPKTVAVPKTSAMSSKASARVLTRGCPCGNLTDKTYYVLFSSGQSYCSECWGKMEKPMGFAQSLEQMKRLGALCFANWTNQRFWASQRFPRMHFWVYDCVCRCAFQRGINRSASRVFNGLRQTKKRI